MDLVKNIQKMNSNDQFLEKIVSIHIELK